MAKKKSMAIPDIVDADVNAELQQKFLKSFVELGTVRKALLANGIERTRWETWRSLDVKFRMAMDMADGEVSEDIEHVAISLAKNCDGKTGERTLLHMLRCRLKERYGDTRKSESSHASGSQLAVQFTSPEAVSAQIIAIAHQFPTVAPTIRKTLQRILEALPV